MLYQLLHEIEAAHETIILSQLATQLQVEESALRGMIDFWVRKGRLHGDEVQTGSKPVPTCSSGGCSGGAQQCPFIMRMPTTFSIAPEPTCNRCHNVTVHPPPSPIK